MFAMQAVKLANPQHQTVYECDDHAVPHWTVDAVFAQSGGQGLSSHRGVCHSSRLGSNVGPDGGPKRPQWISPVTTRNVTILRVVRRGSLQLENMQRRVTDQGSAEEEETSTCAPETPRCGGCCDTGRTHGGRVVGLLDPPWLCSFSVLGFRHSVCRVLLFASSPSEERGAHVCALFSSSDP